MADTVKVRFDPQVNQSGDAQRATQGFGRVSREPPPAFDPVRDLDAAASFFTDHGFVVLADCLGQAELDHLKGEWAASGFDPEVRKAMPRGEQ